MLYSIVVNFKVENEAVIPENRGYHAHALFLDMLRQANPTMAQELHDTEGTKPFTLSPLQGKFQRHTDGIKLAAGAIYWIRFTFLQEDTFAYFMDSALKASERTLRLDKALLRIHEVVTAPGSSPACKCQDFDGILSGASSRRQINLKFLSPTVFRSGGKRNVLFPEPQLLFNSYLIKWQRFSPIKLGNNLPALVEKAARISQYRLDTKILHFNSYQEIGFEGSCAIEIAEEVPEDTARTLNALADFAFYCGSGAKTTMGMGQTRRLGDGRSQFKR